MAGYWTLPPDPMAVTEPSPPEIDGRRLPWEWTIRYRESVILSTITLVRATDALSDNEAGESIAFDISPAHIDSMLSVLDEARGAVNVLSGLAEQAGDFNRTEWSRDLATALSRVEAISRLVTMDPDRRTAGAEPLGLSAGPIMELITVFLNEQSGRALLAELGADDIHRLRVVLTQVVLRVGFDLAGKRLPDELRDDLIERMQNAERVPDLETGLAPRLAEALEKAPPAAGEPTARKVVDAVVNYAPKALDVMKALFEQWDRMDHLTIQLRKRGEQSVVTAEVAVKDGREARLEDIVILQPALVMRGTSRIAVIPSDPETGETIVLFDGVDEGGSVSLEFEGIVYDLVRLFAIPLASGPLREIRVFTGERTRGEGLIHVQLKSLDAGDDTDPRRLLVYQQESSTRLDLEPFDVRTVKERTQHIFHYITPRKRYTFERLTLVPE
jgi:hypothetical protein